MMTCTSIQSLSKGVTDSGIGTQTPDEFDLANSRVVVSPARVGYVARIEHDLRGIEYGLLAAETVDALRQLAGGEPR